MSTKDTRIQCLLERLISLLEKNDCLDWARGFKRLLPSCNTKPKDDVVRKIVRLYGGMGSFNDLILHKDSKPLREENDELDELRDELYTACAEQLTENSIQNIAEKYLVEKSIKFIGPARLGRLTGYKQEVIFLDPLTLDPNVAVVIPEDVRVWVDTKTKEVTPIY